MCVCVSALLSLDDCKQTNKLKIRVLKRNKRQVTLTVVLNISFPLKNRKILIGMNVKCWPELSKSNLVCMSPLLGMRCASSLFAEMGKKKCLRIISYFFSLFLYPVPPPKKKSPMDNMLKSPLPSQNILLC